MNTIPKFTIGQLFRRTILSAIIMSSLTLRLEADVVPILKMPNTIEKIDVKNILRVPIGDMLLDVNEECNSPSGGVLNVKVPFEWSKGATCNALRVSDILVDCETLDILGALSSYVYPTIAEGAFAITNQIIAAVNRISSGKATATPLRFETEKGYCDMIFYWRPDNAKKERELIVRGFVGASKKMGIGCCLHTKGDLIEARYAPPVKNNEEKKDQTIIQSLPVEKLKENNSPKDNSQKAKK